MVAPAVSPPLSPLSPDHGAHRRRSRERREIDAVGEQQDLRADLARALGEGAGGGAHQVRLADQPRLHRLDSRRHAGEADVEVDAVVDQRHVEAAGELAAELGPEGELHQHHQRPLRPQAGDDGVGHPRRRGAVERLAVGVRPPGDPHAQHVQLPLGVEDVARRQQAAAQEAVDVEHRMAGPRQRQRQVLRALEAVAPGDRRQIEDRRPRRRQLGERLRHRLQPRLPPRQGAPRAQPPRRQMAQLAQRRPRQPLDLADRGQRAVVAAGGVEEGAHRHDAPIIPPPRDTLPR